MRCMRTTADRGVIDTHIELWHLANCTTSRAATFLTFQANAGSPRCTRSTVTEEP